MAYWHSLLTATTQDGMKDFKASLLSMGGMPVLEGTNWKEMTWWEILIKTFSNVIIEVANDSTPGPITAECILEYLID